MRTYLCPRKTYAISVIIPMYNAERYVAECLDSLVEQTFQDFEVIVVDDRSIDNSVAIVRAYSSKFGKRLTLTHTEKNSGSGLARNQGLMLSQGEYILFLDSDDFILLTALETLYNAAKEHEADIVYEGTHYVNKPNGISLCRDGLSKKLLNENLEDKTELIVNDPKKNLDRLLLIGDEGTFYAVWSKFFQRKFLLKNKITFPNLSTAQDVVMVINSFCHAKRLLRIPTPLIFYRNYGDSVTRKRRSSEESISYWFFEYINFTKFLHELEAKNEVLQENLDYLFAAFNKQFGACFGRTFEARKQLSDRDIYKILRSKFANDYFGTAISFLFSAVENSKKNNANAETLCEFINYLTSGTALQLFTARMDLKFTTKSRGDFQILSVSDKKATISKPDWFQKDGIGYILQSHFGKLLLIVKATSKGQVNFRLGGISVLNPKDKTKRIPHWVCYTKFVINGKKIFDTLTPAWHDKPLYHKLDAKADEEIKIEVEWLPHMDTRSDISEKTTETQESNIEKLREQEALISELRATLANEKKAAKEQRALIDELRTALINGKMTPEEAIKNKREEMLRNTARLDIKLKGASSFPIQTISDSEAKIIQPAWMLKGGAGYIVTSHVGKLELVAQAEADGQLNLNLRGMDIKDPKDSSKRLPYWIDYTKLVVNGKVIFDKVTPVWHDEPYSYEINVKAGEKVRIQLEWLPHRNNT